MDPCQAFDCGCLGISEYKPGYFYYEGFLHTYESSSSRQFIRGRFEIIIYYRGRGCVLIFARCAVKISTPGIIMGCAERKKEGKVGHELKQDKM
jgi:hypothetical protein